MKSATTSGLPPPPLHSLHLLPRRHFNSLFAAVYTAAISSLLYRHSLKLLHSTSPISLLISLSLLISDLILAFMWCTTQAFRMNPVQRREHPESLEKALDRRDFPGLDIFICTADPYKEPPVDVVNTALSVMAYDYPAEKVSVYVSDDGGSELTMFAFMEAARFGKLWLPFCRENKVTERCPHAYFSSTYDLTAKTLEIKMMYESMKVKVESVVAKGRVSDEYISREEESQILNQYRAKDFSRQNHPSIIQVLLNSNKDVDSCGEPMPNLVYLSREKSKGSPHHFKAGALNALLRVSATMTNSPIILTLDCDMYSNDPTTAQRALCYFLDQSKSAGPGVIGSNYAYVQFPQRYHGINKADIYASEHKRLFLVNAMGLDGLKGPNYVGTGCFFNRRAFFGGPCSYVPPEASELSPDYIVDKPINGKEVFRKAHQVAGCYYENQTSWGSKIGFRYGSLVEDYYTGYRLQCEGWKSALCDPSRAAFLGDIPITINDVLNQVKRWSVGLLEVAFSKCSPLTYGSRNIGILMGLGYAHYSLLPIWSIPITIYGLVPSLALLQGLPIFPKVSEPWFWLYAFLFLGSYGQDCFDFMSTRGTFRRWWSDQRMWLMRASSAFSFGIVEYMSKCLGMETHGFNVTSKVMEDEQSQRYDDGIFEFGVPSPMFLPLASLATLNLVAFLAGLARVSKGGEFDAFFVQMFVAGFGVLNSFPIYGAMFLRRDSGRMPINTTLTSTLLVGALFVLFNKIHV
ncbi:cellulose synthase-like protein G3 isoform X1 [Salvia divinorum]|uniref:Cellulose synthase-like protein G3 isoform X1 n=1 Tax=Salvia divinorum TaxID=28513 RepID=A0ABD1FK53_SALDI